MYIYPGMCAYVCCECVQVSQYVCVCMHAYLCAWPCICACVRTHMFVCMYVFICSYKKALVFHFSLLFLAAAKNLWPGVSIFSSFCHSCPKQGRARVSISFSKDLVASPEEL